MTWLYGPLQTGHSTIAANSQDHTGGALTHNNSFINKKPILKKRSMSEVMLQKSLSASSLVKTAAAAVQAQEKGGVGRLMRPSLKRAATDFATFPFPSGKASRESSSLAPSVTSSGAVSPSVERKHIHFNENVEQCIAVELKGEEDEEDDVHSNDSDSDDGAIMMKRSSAKKRVPIMRRKSKKPPKTSDSKIIAKLPSTTLKYREDTPEPPETAMKHSTGIYQNSILSPSSSQETLRPSKATSNFFFDEDEEAMENMLTPRAGRQPLGSPGKPQTMSSDNLNTEPEGMRRTPSGMFMPYEEGEAATNEGIFGRVVDTVNTARDIAHVIWNVGWRK